MHGETPQGPANRRSERQGDQDCATTTPAAGAVVLLCEFPRTRPLLPAVLLYLLEEGVEDLVFVHLAQGAPPGKDHAVVLAAGHAVVGVARLTGAVDDAAHHGHGEVV